MSTAFSHRHGHAVVSFSAVREPDPLVHLVVVRRFEPRALEVQVCRLSERPACAQRAPSLSVRAPPSASPTPANGVTTPGVVPSP